jgi:hypothetical protein
MKKFLITLSLLLSTTVFAAIDLAKIERAIECVTLYDSRIKLTEMSLNKSVAELKANGLSRELLTFAIKEDEKRMGIFAKEYVSVSNVATPKERETMQAILKKYSDKVQLLATTNIAELRTYTNTSRQKCE